MFHIYIYKLEVATVVCVTQSNFVTVNMGANEGNRFPCLPLASECGAVGDVKFVVPHYCCTFHDDVIKWKHFPRYRPFVRGIHLSPVNSSHKGQWRGALMFTLICAWINGWVNNRAHHDVIVMCSHIWKRNYGLWPSDDIWRYWSIPQG